MKNHQFERIESLLQDILEEMKRLRPDEAIEKRFDLMSNRDWALAQADRIREIENSYIDPSDFFKNISDSTSSDSSALNSDSKAG